MFECVVFFNSFVVRDVCFCQDGVDRPQECLSARECDGGELEFAVDFSEVGYSDGGRWATGSFEGAEEFGGFVGRELDGASNAVNVPPEDIFSSSPCTLGDELLFGDGAALGAAGDVRARERVF